MKWINYIVNGISRIYKKIMRRIGVWFIRRSGVAVNSKIIDTTLYPIVLESGFKCDKRQPTSVAQGMLRNTENKLLGKARAYIRTFHKEDEKNHLVTLKLIVQHYKDL